MDRAQGATQVFLPQNLRGTHTRSAESIWQTETTVADAVDTFGTNLVIQAFQRKRSKVISSPDVEV
jgi:hypothetical protein